jgi:sec-independent protein translocase protein TatA
MELFGLGVPEIILILVVFLVFFGKDKLPELAKSIGTSFKELKKGFSTEVDSKEKTDAITKKSK